MVHGVTLAENQSATAPLHVAPHARRNAGNNRCAHVDRGAIAGKLIRKVCGKTIDHAPSGSTRKSAHWAAVTATRRSAETGQLPACQFLRSVCPVYGSGPATRYVESSDHARSSFAQAPPSRIPIG